MEMLNLRKLGSSIAKRERQKTPAGTVWPALCPTPTWPVSKVTFSCWEYTTVRPASKGERERRVRGERDEKQERNRSDMQLINTFTNYSNAGTCLLLYDFKSLSSCFKQALQDWPRDLAFTVFLGQICLVPCSEQCLPEDKLERFWEWWRECKDFKE